MTSHASSMNNDVASRKMAKVCFVTIGATASFNSLITQTISTTFAASLLEQRYTDLIVQYGADGKDLFESRRQEVKAPDLTITGFGIDRTGLSRYMRLAKTGSGVLHTDDGPMKFEVGLEGVVISHAGSGTILDALRLSVPLIVVPNTELLDNHQIELAEALAGQGYVVHGDLNNLGQALISSEELRKMNQSWPPVNSGVHRQAKGFKGVMDEEMGYLD